MVSKLGSSIIRSMFLIICSVSLIANVKSAPNPVTDLRKVVNIINDITTLFTGMDGIIKLAKNDDSDKEFQKKVENELDNIYKACSKIDNVKEEIRNLTSVIDANAIHLIEELSLREDMNYVLEINNKLNIIGTRYENDFKKIYPYIKDYTHEEIDTYIASIIDNDDLKDKLTEILKATKLPDGHDPYPGKNVFEIAVAYSKNEKNHHRECDSISAYDRLFNFYQYVITTVTQGYTMIIMSYEYRKLKSSDPTFNKNRQYEYLNIYKQSIIKITESIQYYLNSNNNINFKSTISCDPQSWGEGRNYIRIKNYVSIKSSETIYEGFQKLKPDTRGIEYECVDFAEYANLEDEKLIVTKHCPTALTSTHPDSSYSESPDFSTIFTGRRCHLGVQSIVEDDCYRDQNSDRILSVRKLSLSWQTCDPQINEVVTNMQFHVQEGIISIKIQCGTIINGTVDINTLRWIEDERPYTKNNHPEYVVLSGTLKSFNMDDILLPDGEFVTGVKFETLADNHLSLVIQGTKMYDSDNKIIKSYSTSRFPENTGNSRVNIDLNQLSAPQDITKQTYEMSQSGSHYVDIAISKWSDKYTGNAELPFLDMRPVTVSPVTPLGGIGLYYKSIPGYGGFIDFKHISPKYVHFIPVNYAEKLTITPPA
ncbi:uncharacterized protein LOC130677479 [Microplitis mediator]|uniref:uncharacterized protein LOC130677479 n=1 Tax=Microplitis mediator TaxID=375433 RepID=UPI0025532E22|nr:uncharacterized protein LOC130677479 [Microplitis mediator]